MGGRGIFKNGGDCLRYLALLMLENAPLKEGLTIELEEI